ncbi:MAG: tripartite tricarboxylate transporter permease [Candidatus Thermoplasmatota archaeon]|nr:tripartite tricarboxylate transporter permease [Candidatus Thermoplasmatota archaeon]
MIEVLGLIVLFCLLGTLLGTFTGLTPGVHVNNVAIILLSLSPSIAAIIGVITGLDEWTILLLVGATVVATSMAHTFLDFIPSTFLGAPEGDTALSVLPAHSMLLEGRGFTAVHLSAVGSFGAVMVGFILLLPYMMLMNEPVGLYSFMKSYIPYILMGVCILMLVTESASIPYLRKRNEEGITYEKGLLSRPLGVALACFQFVLAGTLGLLILDMNVSSPFGLMPSVLFPALSGLFGTSTLIESLRGGASVPHQRIERQGVDLKEAAPSIVSGGIAGSVVGFLPGMSGGIATVIAMLFRKDPKPSSVILTLSAINTANSFFVLSALFIILRPRSGAAIVVDQLIDVRQWSAQMPQELSLLLISALIASTLGFFLTLFMGKRLANIMPRMPYRKVVVGIIVFITAMVFAFTGWIGVIILAVSTMIGMIPPLTGIRRTHSMGVLMVPVLFMLW